FPTRRSSDYTPAASLSEQAGAGESASGDEVPRRRTPGPRHPGHGLRLRGAVAGAARPLLEDGERPGRNAADGGADRERTGRGVGYLRTGTAGPAHRVHRRSVRRARSRVVQPAQSVWAAFFGCRLLYQSSPCSPPSCPRISPPGLRGVACTFAYANPARMAAITSPSSPAVICWLAVLAAITLAAVMCPVTVPDCGQNGVRPATVAGAGVVAVWHSQITMLPFTPGCAKWICACCTVPISPLYESSYSIMPSSRLILASNSPLAGVDTEGTSL